MANKIQIKRSTTTAAPTGLANGELAYTANGEILFLGHPDGTTGSIAIGGRRVPGTLTANQALVANSSSAIDKVITANLTIQNNTTYGILTQSSTGNSTVSEANIVFTSNTASQAFNILTAATNAGNSSPQLLLSTGDVTGSGSPGNINLISGSKQTGTSSLISLKAGGQTNTTGGSGGQVLILGGDHTGGGGGGTDVLGGTVTVRGGSVTNASATTTNKKPGGVVIEGGTSANVTGLVAPSILIGATNPLSNIVIGSTSSGNTIIYANNTVGTAGQILTSNGTSTYWGAAPSGVTDITDSANATTVTIISSTGADAVLDSANATTAGILTSADWTKLNNMPANSVAGSTTQVMFNNAGVLAGDAGFTFVTATDALTLGGSALTTAPLFSVANTGGSANLTSATLTIGTSVVNSTAVASGANVYLTTSTLFAGNATINASHTSSLVQVSNSTSTANVTAAGFRILDTIANTTGLFVGANVFANASAFDVGNTVITSTNLTLGGQVTANGGAGTANNVLVSGGAGNAYWTNSLSLTDITLSGNLTINGTLTTVDTTNLVVKDPLIKLANGNVTSDTIDIGFFGVYDTTNSQDRFAGIFRDASDGTFKVFANTTIEPTTTVDIAGVGYTTGTIQSFLTTGNTTFGTTSPFFVANATSVSINSDRLIANSTALNITANATVSVALTANSLSLTTALPATSGGTGTGTYTSGDLLVANTGNTLSKLSLGTDGKVLQSNGTAVVYADLDGGTF